MGDVIINSLVVHVLRVSCRCCIFRCVEVCFFNQFVQYHDRLVWQFLHLVYFDVHVLGSTLTPTATSFALSVFTQLLHHSFQCISQLVISAINIKYSKKESGDLTFSKPSESEIIMALERGKTIMDVLLEHNVPEVVSREKTETKQKKTTIKYPSSSPSPRNTHAGKDGKVKKLKIIDRRRRRVGGGAQMPSSEEDSESDDDSPGSIGGELSSDEDLSLISDTLGEDDLELLDSLSDSSFSDEAEEEEQEEEEQGEKLKSAVSVDKSNVFGHASSKKVGKRQIILAANFNMPAGTDRSLNPEHKPGKATGGDDISSGLGSTKHLSSFPEAHPPINLAKDSQLQELTKSTVFQTAVYIACCLVAEESSLMALRVFTHWLQSYPIIIATCTPAVVCQTHKSFKR